MGNCSARLLWQWPVLKGEWSTKFKYWWNISWINLFLADAIRTHPLLRFLSCSMYKTMTIREVDPSRDIWCDRIHVGEIGGNTQGLEGCWCGNHRISILAHGYQGALHLWHDVEVVIDDLVFIFFVLTFFIFLNGQWNPGVVCSEYFDSLADFILDPSGDFAVTVSTSSMSPHISSFRLSMISYFMYCNIFYMWN